MKIQENHCTFHIFIENTRKPLYIHYFHWKQEEKHEQEREQEQAQEAEEVQGRTKSKDVLYKSIVFNEHLFFCYQHIFF